MALPLPYFVDFSGLNTRVGSVWSEESGVRSQEHNCLAADARRLPANPCFPIATGKWPEGPIGDFYESFNCFALYERPIPRIASLLTQKRYSRAIVPPGESSTVNMRGLREAVSGCSIRSISSWAATLPIPALF